MQLFYLKWHAWDLLQPTYSTEINVPSGIKEVIIDPTNRLADAYMPDNSSKCNTSFKFNDNLWKYPDWKKYEIKLPTKYLVELLQME